MAHETTDAKRSSVAVPRLALAGAGPWGRILLRNLVSLAEVRVAGVATRQADIDALLPPGAVRVAGWPELLARRPDGLIIATPAGTHAAVALAAIDQGIPALVEKPLALDVASAMSVRRAARARSLLLLVNHIDLSNPAWRAVIAAAGPAGPGESIEIDVGGPGPFRSDCDPLWDWGPHAVGLALDRLGPDAAIAGAGTRPGTGDGAAGQVITAELQRADGARARLSFGNGFPEKVRRAVIRAGASAYVYDDRSTVRAAALRDGQASPLPHAATSPVVAALLRFVERLQARPMPRPPEARGADDDLDLSVAVVARLAELARRLERGA